MKLILDTSAYVGFMLGYSQVVDLFSRRRPIERSSIRSAR